MDRLLEIEELTKRFGPITAVEGVSFSVARGEVLGFLGPNGAGKTTTMRMVTGYLPPSSGTARVCGFDVGRQPIEVKRRIGYLPEGAPAYGDMTPLGLLGFVADLRDLKGAGRKERIDAAVERLALGSVLHRPIETLSKGFKRRVGLAQAILADPEVLILDEPTDGLDPNQKHEVRQLLTEMAGDKAIVISTHILEEVEAICSRAIIVAAGRIVADATPEALLARAPDHRAVGLRLAADHAAGARAALDALPAVARVETLAASNGAAALRAYPADGQEILGPVQQAIAAAGIALDEIYVERGRLDEVFRALTQR
ncbi:MAG: ABC transporter ATP-binding protein [Kiloniellales bacterium]|nr:ABC transporter ATP-binding protein [Kiloniellales bacterium]